MKSLILFDKECPLCRKSVGFVLAHDTKHRFLFAPLSGETARASVKNKRLLKENTLILFEDWRTPQERLWIRGRGAFRILWLLGGKWRLLGWLCFIPLGVDLVYRLIARHRRRLPISGDLPHAPGRFLD